MGRVPPLRQSSNNSVLDTIPSRPKELTLVPEVPGEIVNFDTAKAFPLPLERKYNAVLKRSFDVLIAGTLLLLVFPWFLLLAALMIKIESKGPVFFRQKRVKKGNRVFTCIKLRTMYVNKEADTLAATRNDPRITRVGRVLRNTHLDELPQLLNVLAGDMSLIGPRPHMISDNSEFGPLIDQYAVRHQVKPGITGLAQVSGFTGPVTDINVMRKRIEKDLYYVYSWNPFLDVKIIGRTLSRMIFPLNNRQ